MTKQENENEWITDLFDQVNMEAQLMAINQVFYENFDKLFEPIEEHYTCYG